MKSNSVATAAWPAKGTSPSTEIAIEIVAAPPQPTEEDMDLDREIEYAFETEETMSSRPPAGDVE